MKRTLLYLVSFCQLALYSCGGNSEKQENDKLSSSKEVIAQQDEASISPELQQKVVGQYGEKSGQQLKLEEMLEQMKASRLTHQNKEIAELMGHWVGDFGVNKINITIVGLDDSSVENPKAYGYSVCAGNFRALTGNYRVLENQVYAFEFNEPGDDPFDGKFDFLINLDKSVLAGNWTPFIAKGNSPKKFELSKKEYLYNPSIGYFPEASQRLLTAEEVGFYYPEDLTYMRNEIYARHGYSFKNKDMRYFFEEKDWYMPMGTDVRYNLTPVEIANIGLIYEYETYFDDYYDEYGR
jgi:hypothetical protein